MSRSTAYGLAFGICLPFGVALGVSLDNIGVGIAFGVAVTPLAAIAIRQSKIEEWRKSRKRSQNDRSSGAASGDY